MVSHESQSDDEVTRHITDLDKQLRKAFAARRSNPECRADFLRRLDVQETSNNTPTPQPLRNNQPPSELPLQRPRPEPGPTGPTGSRRPGPRVARKNDLVTVNKIERLRLAMVLAVVMKIITDIFIR